MNKKTRCLAVVITLALTLATASSWAQNTMPGRANILFTQQDEVKAFDPATGTGYQIGTAVGKISGTSYVAFTFTAPASDGTFTFKNVAIITDLDGDQITFENVGRGVFHPIVQGTVGTLTGTYEVTIGTGKYASWVGNKYNYSAVATNPPILAFGNVYAEIYSNKVKN